MSRSIAQSCGVEFSSKQHLLCPAPDLAMAMGYFSIFKTRKAAW